MKEHNSGDGPSTEETAKSVEESVSEGPASIEISKDQLIELITSKELSEAGDVPEGAVLMAASKSSHHRGPLPPPEMMNEYNQVIPDLSERIVRAWEEEAIHRRSCEKHVVMAHVFDVKLGRGSALAFALIALGLTGYALYLDQPWVAGVLGSGTIGAVVTAFLNPHSKDNEPDEKS